MKKISLFIAFPTGILLAGCTAEDPPLQPDTSAAQRNEISYRKSLNDALKSADKIMADISLVSETRGSLNRRIASVQIVGDNKKSLTRGAVTETDTMLYLVNYADDQGFALLSADWRTKPVYAISDEGNLDLADTTFNQGLALFLENARADYISSTSSLSNYERPSIPIDTTDINHPDFPVDDYEYTLYYDVQPMLGAYPSCWHQRFPFNKYVMIDKGADYPVGCVALALAQLCSVAGSPVAFEGRTLDWTTINQTPHSYPYSTGMDDLAFFLWKAGVNYLDMQYSNDGSTTTLQKIDSFLSDMNLNSSGVKNYSGSVPRDSYPVAMGATSSDGINGHAWILDGGISYKIQSNMYVNGYAFYHFEHCVWGWEGRDNGYYSWSSEYGFTYDHPGENDDTGTPSTNPNQYVSNFQYIYIRK